jgi:hypothetical protein
MYLITASYGEKLMMKRYYPGGDALQWGSIVKDQNMQDEHDVEGNTTVSGDGRYEVMQMNVVRAGMRDKMNNAGYSDDVIESLCENKIPGRGPKEFNEPIMARG